jgi:ATP-dependent DNA helicase RecG
MNFRRKKISYAAYIRLIDRSEAHFLDFKDKRIQPAKLCKTVSALANSDGGEIYIGITELPDRKFEWNGFKDEEEANAIIQVVEDMLYVRCHYEPEFLEYAREPGLVLRLTINKSNSVISTPAKKIYRRKNAQDLELITPEEIRRLELNKGSSSHEDFSINVGLSLIADSDAMRKFLKDNESDLRPEEFLRMNNLIQTEPDVKPRVSGILLFGDNPQSFVNRCGIKIVTYNTSAEAPERKDMVGIPLSQEGCMYKLIYNTVEKIEKIVKEMSFEDQEGDMYPRETVHEIIANAVLHRDYSIKEDIQIRIFDDRIEVESPGLLPGYVTIRNILSQRYSRNGTLVRIINKFQNPPNKDIGEGLNTAFQAMMRSGLMYPEIKQKENSVLAIIHNEKMPDSTECLLRLLKTYDQLDASEIHRKRVFKSEVQQKKILKRLVDDGVIEKVSGSYGSDTTYRLPTSKNKG